MMRSARSRAGIIKGADDDRRIRPLRPRARAGARARSSSVPMIGARKNDPVLMAVAGPTALAQFCFVAIAFAALMTCYMRSDFSVVNVFENSHSAKPLVYKISGVWGNHEGSMLLWVLILSVFGALVALFGGNLPARLKANVLAVQSWIAVAFHAFHPGHVEPVPAHCGCAIGGPRPQSRSCRIPASPFIRRCSMSAMSASRSRFPSPSPR